MLNDIDAAVFDMDGVLIDTEPLYQRAEIAAAAQLGFDMSVALSEKMIGAPHDVGRVLLTDAFGAGFPVDEFNRLCHAEVEAAFQETLPVKPGVIDLLEALRAGGLGRAVATSTASPAAPDRLRAVGLLDYFDTVVTRNDVSRGKPHPEPFLTAAARLGVEPGRCLAFEDSHNGVRSAHAAGMRVIMVPDLLPATPEIRAMCHAVMDSLTAFRLAAFEAAE